MRRHTFRFTEKKRLHRIIHGNVEKKGMPIEYGICDKTELLVCPCSVLLTLLLLIARCRYTNVGLARVLMSISCSSSSSLSFSSLYVLPFCVRSGILLSTSLTSKPLEQRDSKVSFAFTSCLFNYNDVVHVVQTKQNILSSSIGRVKVFIEWLNAYLMKTEQIIALPAIGINRTKQNKNKKSKTNQRTNNNNNNNK